MDLITGIELSAFLFIKIALVLFLLFYIIFAGVVIKQVKVMTESVRIGFERPLRVAAFIHFLFALVTFFLSVFTI